MTEWYNLFPFPEMNPRLQPVARIDEIKNITISKAYKHMLKLAITLTDLEVWRHKRKQTLKCINDLKGQNQNIKYNLALLSKIFHLDFLVKLLPKSTISWHVVHNICSLSLVWSDDPYLQDVEQYHSTKNRLILPPKKKKDYTYLSKMKIIDLPDWELHRSLRTWLQSFQH